MFKSIELKGFMVVCTMCDEILKVEYPENTLEWSKDIRRPCASCCRALGLEGR